MGICILCPRYYDENKEKKLSCKLGVIGIIFCDTCNMGNTSNNIRNEGSGKNDHSHIVLPDFDDNFLSYIPTLCHNIFKNFQLIPQKEMATYVGWKIFYIIGISFTSLSFWISSRVTILDIQLSQTPVAFQNVTYFFTSLFLLILVLRGIGKLIEQVIKIREIWEDFKFKRDERKPKIEIEITDKKQIG